MTLVHGDLADDDDHEDLNMTEDTVLVRSLMHSSHFVLQTRGLKSGQSREVDGQISLGRGALLPRHHPFLPQILQYKVLDNGVRFFGKGLATM